jgi:N-methylhydantoinase A
MARFIGVDIGGTFTDCVAVGDDGQVVQAKALSTKADPSDGVMTGLAALASAAGVELAELLGSAERLAHGTTIGTNLVVERKGATVAVLTTAGHRDALLIMRGHGRVAGRPADELFNLQATDMPVPLVPRSRIAEVHERIDASGAVVVELDEHKAEATVAELAALLDSVDAVAISLLWAFRNPRHEQLLADAVRRAHPDLHISISSKTAPRLGEFERCAATVIDSYVGPASTRYLQRAGERLSQAGLERPLLIMQSNGGVLPVEAVKDAPITLIDSGPAGGLAGAVSLAAQYGHANVIATDMGGTSFDVGLIVDGQPLIRHEGVIEQYTYYLPHLDMRSIACGGGTIARHDPHSRSIAVGPESAGSEPGPACYGRGGQVATVTDADVVLGLVEAAAFLGGEMPLDREAARAAVTRVGKPLGLSAEEVAAGIIRINNNHAATLIRQQTLQRGYDARDFALYAYGGAGPVHAFGYARELGVAEIVIPLGNGASTLSAFGMASSDVVQYFEREESHLAPFDAAALAAAVEDLEAQARASFVGLHLDRGELRLERIAVIRYAEQFMQAVPVTVPDGPIDAEAAAGIVDRFEAEYSRLYGAGAKLVFRTIELFAMQVKATVELDFASPDPVAVEQRNPDPDAQRGTRPVFWPDRGAWSETAVWAGAQMQPGDRVAGPAVIELPHTTVAVAPGQRAVFDGRRSVVMSI